MCFTPSRPPELRPIATSWRDTPTTAKAQHGDMFVLWRHQQLLRPTSFPPHLSNGCEARSTASTPRHSPLRRRQPLPRPVPAARALAISACLLTRRPRRLRLPELRRSGQLMPHYSGPPHHPALPQSRFALRLLPCSSASAAASPPRHDLAPHHLPARVGAYAKAAARDLLRPLRGPHPP